METTNRLSLPLIVPGQAQKELFHNEALLTLDSLVAGAVEDLPANDPPQSPTEGQCFLVGDAPSGDWSEYPGHVAAWSSAGWRFIAPCPGMALLVKSSGLTAVYGASGWEVGALRASQLVVDGMQVVGPQAAAIADPAGGTSIDAEARAAISEMLAALRQHGLISA